jgi:hypothetical protein
MCLGSPQPILIATLVGEEPSLPSILLNSHYDVVPAVEAMWKVSGLLSHCFSLRSFFSHPCVRSTRGRP